ncbi:hypothetical protein M2440_000424 [Methylorubrum extorquens]|nr:hypothetical protein [Methylorubrum extorquens]
MQRKVKRKRVASFCATQRAHHDTAAAAALHIAGTAGHKSRRVRPHCHAGSKRLTDQVFVGMARFKGEAGQRDTEEHGGRGVFGKALGLRHEIDHEAQHRGRCVCRQTAKAETADLD